jgi:hypothetical protein
VAIVTIPPSTASVIFGLTYNYVAILSDWSVLLILIKSKPSVKANPLFCVKSSLNKMYLIGKGSDSLISKGVKILPVSLSWRI